MQMKFPMALIAVAVLAGCASQGGGSGAASTSGPSSTAGAKASTPSDVRIVKSRDGRFEGEMVGTPAPGSKFSRVQIGMEMNEVTKLIGGADEMTSNETGKRWIPFYFGNDTRRVHLIYKGEGCLSFTGGNVYGGGGNELVRITADPTGRKCAE